MNNSRIWVLGAPDPEMQMVEGLLREMDQQIAYACTDAGRVRPSEAYQATHARWDPAGPATHGPDAHVAYVVECASVDDHKWHPWHHATIIDHHWPGDPGYGRPPAEFLLASSLGQVISRLAQLERIPEFWQPCIGLPRARVGAIAPDNPPSDRVCGTDDKSWRVQTSVAYARVIPRDYVLAAAADHCLAAAYRGECPGVDPDALMRWRVTSRARFQGRPEAEVLRDVEAARQALRTRPTIDVAGGAIADCRDVHIPELPEAASREGIAFISTPITPDGRRKINLMGGTPAQIQAFLDGEVMAGLRDTYGDPARGFAGGYQP